jgi:peptidoglycan/xylan/chitin deacetylase (PgdA/CDA1 family)
MNNFYPYRDFSFSQRNDHPNQYLNSRGSWTPFTWVEKYNYAFSGPYNTPAVALTFDDGPDPVFTPLILDKLKKYGVKATFFLLGTNIEKFPEIVNQISVEGHLIGNHTYSHPRLTDITDEEYHYQIHKTDELIQQLVGYKPKFFRPPYGVIEESQLKWANEQGMMVTQWSIDTLDWQGLDAEKITQTVMANVLPGSIILQHNAPDVPLQGSVDALDQIIPQLQAKATRFVTLSEMFNTTLNRGYSATRILDYY